MNLNVDSGKLLYALGVVFAAAAFAYFVRDLVFGLSITVKALLLFVAFVGFFVSGIAIQRDVLDVVAFALSALAYVVFVGYVLSRYDLAETATFLVFAGSAVLFVGLGYSLRERSVTVSRRTAGYVLLGLVAVSAVFVGADLYGGDVTYTIEVTETVTVERLDEGPRDREVYMAAGSVGTVTATNDFVFTRTLELPTVRGCVLGTDAVEENRITLQYDQRRYDRSGTIPGNTERSFDLTVQVPVDANATQPPEFAVEKADDCEGSRTEPTLLVVTGERPTPPTPR